MSSWPHFVWQKGGHFLESVLMYKTYLDFVLTLKRNREIKYSTGSSDWQNRACKHENKIVLRLLNKNNQLSHILQNVNHVLSSNQISVLNKKNDMWLCCFSSLENVSNLSIIFKSIISLILLIIPVLQMWWKHKQEIIKLPLESWNYWVKQDTKMFYLTPCPIDFYAFSVLWTKCRRVMFKKYWLDCYLYT